MALQPGTTLGPYAVTAKIGEGGMGEVYRARDTKLDRDVALKVLPEAFTADPDRLARFEREAKVLASLNHPNIGSIYGLEEAEGVKALVLELVEGPTLADRIKRGAIPFDEALPIAKQIAEALEAAHEQGVIHRDLKPANIKVKDDGTVKVLDFGLAKALGPDSDGSPSESPTQTAAAATRTGVLMGTAAYMSPEQARAESVDRRSDVWAFGCVLFEMLTGTCPFAGKGASETLANVLKGEPDWGGLPGNTPALVRRLLRRCLDKERKERLQHIGDARVDIRDALDGTSAAETAAVPTAHSVGRSRTLMWLGVVATALLAGLGGWLANSRLDSDVELSMVRFEIPARMTVSPFSRIIAISPDGTHIAHAGLGAPLAVRSMDQSGTPRELHPTGRGPFFSPDGDWVGFFDGGLWRTPTRGGAASFVTEIGATRDLGASWGADDTIVFATTLGLYRVSAEGGEPELLAAPQSERGELFYSLPDVLPNGKVALFTIVSEGTPRGAQIAALDLGTGEQTIVLHGGSSARYATTGHLVYVEGARLHAVAFDSNTLEVRGEPVPLLAEAGANFDVSQTGTLAYVPAREALTSGSVLVWVDRGGRVEPLSAPPGGYSYPRVSRDGTKIAVALYTAGVRNIHIWDLERSNMSRLTDPPSEELFPEWSADGRRVFFASNRRNGLMNVFSRMADGTGQAELLLESRSGLWPMGLTPDGRQLLVLRTEGGAGDTGRDMMMLTVDEPIQAETLLATEYGEMNGAISPDGEWLAYESDASGRLEVYVGPFPDVDRQRWKISIDGGRFPLWATEGDALFYVSGTGAMMAATVELTPSFEAGAVSELFPSITGRPVSLVSAGGRPYDVSPVDGRFLMVRPREEAEGSNITVVLNWFKELTARVPGP